MRLRLIAVGALVTSLALGQASPTGPAYTPTQLPSLVVGSPTGGNEGAGSVNMASCFVNGVACSTGGGSSGANPTGTVGLSTVNGAASTFLRSDGAPPLSQSIVPTWTGVHTFSATPVFSAGITSTVTPVGATSGGTGQGVYAVGDLLYASTTTALSRLADVATGSVLASGGVGTIPSWSTAFVSSISGTSNQISASASNGAVTLSLPSQILVPSQIAPSYATSTFSSGTTQGSNALTHENNTITVTVAGTAATLFTGLAGEIATINLLGSNNLILFPPSSSQIDANGNNTSITLTAPGTYTFMASSGFQWYSILRKPVAASNVTVTEASGSETIGLSANVPLINAANSWTAAQTITPAANSYSLSLTPPSLTSGTTGSGISIVNTINDASAVDGAVFFSNTTCTTCTATTYLMDIQVSGTSELKLTNTGILTAGSKIVSGSDVQAAAGANVTWNGRGIMDSPAANQIQLGGPNAAAPAAQTFMGQGSRGGTDSNVGGGNVTIQSGDGTGTGAVSSIIFQTPQLAGSGSTQQTMATQLTVGTGLLTTAAGVMSGGTTFTVTVASCGTTNGTPTSVTGGAEAGTFVTASSGTGCVYTITINGATGSTASHGWLCAGGDFTSGVVFTQNSITDTTHCKLTGTTAATTDTVWWTVLRGY